MESADSQLGMFADFSDELQEEILKASLESHSLESINELIELYEL